MRKCDTPIPRQLLCSQHSEQEQAVGASMHGETRRRVASTPGAKLKMHTTNMSPKYPPDSRSLLVELVHSQPTTTTEVRCTRHTWVGEPRTIFSHQALVGKLVCSSIEALARSPQASVGQVLAGRSMCGQLASAGFKVENGCMLGIMRRRGS